MNDISLHHGTKEIYGIHPHINYSIFLEKKKSILFLVFYSVTKKGMCYLFSTNQNGNQL